MHVCDEYTCKHCAYYCEFVQVFIALAISVTILNIFDSVIDLICILSDDRYVHAWTP